MAKGNPIATGTRFERLVVVSDEGGRCVRVRCDCGADRIVSRCRLKSRETRSCGCLSRDVVLLRNSTRSPSLAAGERFDRLTVIADADPYAVRCRCVCGKEMNAARFDLRRGHTRSCGCLTLEVNTKHGDATRSRGRTQIHAVWTAMKHRCSNPRSQVWKRYGGRGIRVCARWRHSFEAFRDDMGPRPAGASLDRIDNDGNYEPGNVRWATPAEQSRNTSKVSLIEHNGETLCLEDWAKRHGIRGGTLHSRLFKMGWAFERAVSTPVRAKKKTGH